VSACSKKRFLHSLSHPCVSRNVVHGTGEVHTWCLTSYQACPPTPSPASNVINQHLPTVRCPSCFPFLICYSPFFYATDLYRQSHTVNTRLCLKYKIQFRLTCTCTPRLSAGLPLDWIQYRADLNSTKKPNS
jgi:hypothetical protein